MSEAIKLVVYKCRMCGEQFTVQMPKSGGLIVLGHFDRKDDSEVLLVEKHTCNARTVGFGDLMGIVQTAIYPT